MLVTRPDPRLVDIVDAAIRGGVNMVQVRGSAPEPICAAVGERARIVVNASVIPSVARDLGEWAGVPRPRIPAPARPSRSLATLRMTTAWGVHLPERTPGRCVSRSVHSVEAAMRAQAEGCEFLVAGTIFPSASHPNGPVAGVKLIEEITRKVKTPVIAIGGITPANARSCIDAGASGVAVISYLMDAADPEAAARELVQACS